MTQDSPLVAAARAIGPADPDPWQRLARAADARTRELIDGFVHQAGPPPGHFAWVALGSHARGELHCASDQDHALVWTDDRAAATSYATDLAVAVQDGLVEFGMRRCSGGYMASQWSCSLAGWVTLLRERIAAPTAEAVLDTDVFLDFRPLAGDLDVSPAAAVLASGSDSGRLLHGLAVAANAFPAPLGPFGRLPRGELDLKRSGLAPTVLLARVYGLRARTSSVSTVGRLQAAGATGGLSREISDRLIAGFTLMSRLRLRQQLAQVDRGEPITDVVVVDQLDEADQDGLRDALRAVKATQSATALTFRTDL